MADTYNGVDIGTKEGREAQITALLKRLDEWNIDYWRSDFDVLKPNNYLLQVILIFAMSIVLRVVHLKILQPCRE